MNKLFLFSIIFFFSFGQIFSAPIILSNKTGIYKDSFNLQINFVEPIKKILWTRNPDGSPDEMFVYEKKIPIKYSQEIWYFGLLDGNRATKFFMNNFILNINSSRFNYGFKFSEFSPNNNWIELRNEGSKERMLVGWLISGLNFEEKIKTIRLKPFETKKIFLQNKIGNDLDRIKLLDPNGETRSRIEFKKNIGKHSFYKRGVGELVFKIIKN